MACQREADGSAERTREGDVGKGGGAEGEGAGGSPVGGARNLVSLVSEGLPK